MVGESVAGVMWDLGLQPGSLFGRGFPGIRWSARPGQGGKAPSRQKAPCRSYMVFCKGFVCFRLCVGGALPLVYGVLQGFCVFSVVCGRRLAAHIWCFARVLCVFGCVWVARRRALQNESTTSADR